MNLSHLRLSFNWLRRLVIATTLLGAPLLAQTVWYASTQDVTKQNLWSVAYGNSTLVAVGEHGTIISLSYADRIWVPGASGSAEWLVGAGYGAGRFVVVGDRGTILTSDDSGVTWTPRTSGTTTRLNAAVYGNGRWLVIGEQGAVLTSTDGTTWTSRPALGGGFLRALAFGQGRFLIGGAGGTLFTTTDGVTFTAVPIATTADIEGAAIGTNHFYVVGSGGLLATAAQLGTWTITSSASGKTFRGVLVHADDDATAVSDREAMTTHAGGQWASQYFPPPFFATAITHGLDDLVAVGFGGGVARSGLGSPEFIVATPFPNVVYGGEARFTLFSDFTPLTSQWTVNGADVSGGTATEFVLRNITAAASVGVKFTTAVGTRTAPAVALTIVPGGRPEVRDASFNPALPAVPTLIVPQADGKLLVAGSFSVPTAGGSTYGLARLNLDGSIDANFRAGAGIAATSSINGLAPLADGRIYVWGSFSSIAGQSRPGIARLLSTGSLDTAFNPDSALGFPTAAAVAPDGRLYVQNGDPNNGTFGAPVTSVISRLALDGSRDATFVPVQKNRLTAVDAQGRLLAMTLTPGDPSRFLVRYLLDGSRDNSYTATPVQSFNGVTQWAEDLLVTQLTPTGLYATARTASRFFGGYSFWRVKPDGGRDSTYQSAPPISVDNTSPSSAQVSFAYGADGSLWITRGIDNSFNTYTMFRAESYGASGAANPTQYATLPDLSPFRISTVTPNGTLLGIAGTSSAKVPTLFRIKPITGRVGRLTNLSVRAFVTSANDPLIAGFVTSGTDTTRAIVRAIGPGLVQFGVSDAMTDPRLALTRDGATAATNDDWPAALAPRFTSVGAFPLTTGSKDAALESTVAVGNYTAVITPAPGDSGTSLVELYESADAPPAPRRFINVSARGPVASSRPLIVGFSVTGDVPVSVLVRSAGPALTQFGVTGALADPQLALFRADARLWTNDNWAPNNTDFRALQNAAAQNGAFAFTPGSNDAAMLVTLAPGNYTAVVTGANNSSGVSLVEVYEVP